PTANRRHVPPPSLRSSLRESAQTPFAAREEPTVGSDPAHAGCYRGIWALEEPPPPTVPSVAPLRSVAADVSRLKLHSRPAKKRPFEVIRLTPDATAGYGPSRSRHRRPRHPSAPIDQYVLGGKFTR